MSQIMMMIGIGIPIIHNNSDRMAELLELRIGK